jgi:hypothetical protein
MRITTKYLINQADQSLPLKKFSDQRGSPKPQKKADMPSKSDRLPIQKKGTHDTIERILSAINNPKKIDNISKNTQKQYRSLCQFVQLFNSLLTLAKKPISIIIIDNGNNKPLTPQVLTYNKKLFLETNPSNKITLIREFFGHFLKHYHSNLTNNLTININDSKICCRRMFNIMDRFFQAHTKRLREAHEISAYSNGQPVQKKQKNTPPTTFPLYILPDDPKHALQDDEDLSENFIIYQAFFGLVPTYGNGDEAEDLSTNAWNTLTDENANITNTDEKCFLSTAITILTSAARQALSQVKTWHKDNQNKQAVKINGTSYANTDIRKNSITAGAYKQLRTESQLPNKFLEIIIDGVWEAIVTQEDESNMTNEHRKLFANGTKLLLARAEQPVSSAVSTVTLPSDTLHSLITLNNRHQQRYHVSGDDDQSRNNNASTQYTLQNIK